MRATMQSTVSSRPVPVPVSSLSTLDDWLAHCERLHPITIDMSLERVRTVARRLEIQFDCPVITVAGTNGKGSTCAMLESILGQAGYRTGVPYGISVLTRWSPSAREIFQPFGRFSRYIIWDSLRSW